MRSEASGESAAREAGVLRESYRTNRTAEIERAKAIEEAASNAVPMMQMAWKQYGVGGMFECMDALRAALAKIGGGA